MFRLTPPLPYQPAFCVALPHAIVAGVHLPGLHAVEAPVVPDDVLDALHPEERTHARALRGFRQMDFVGGRLALAQVLPELGARPTPVLPDAHGAPDLPRGLVGSITHKKDLAVAAVARGTSARFADAGRGGAFGLGIDLEEVDRPRPGVAERVLRPEELEAVGRLPADRQWVDTAVRFAVKEAVYKALHPFLRRYIGFGEVAVWTTPDGVDEIEAHLQEGPRRFHFEARHYWIGHRVLATVRARPAESGRSPAPEGAPP